LTTEQINMNATNGSTDSNGKGDGQKGKEVAADSESPSTGTTFRDDEDEGKGDEETIPRREARWDPDGTNVPVMPAPSWPRHSQVHNPNHNQSAYNQINIHHSILHNPVFNQGTHNGRANQANGQVVNGGPSNGHVVGGQTPDGHGRRTDEIKTRACPAPSALPSQHAASPRRPSFRRAREWAKAKVNSVRQKFRQYRGKLRFEGFREEVGLLLDNSEARDL
jgi:hypothetical protein